MYVLQPCRLLTKPDSAPSYTVMRVSNSGWLVECSQESLSPGWKSNSILRGGLRADAADASAAVSHCPSTKETISEKAGAPMASRHPRFCR